MRKQVTCRCGRLHFPHRRDWHCVQYEWELADRERYEYGVPVETIINDNRERARDCNAASRGH